SELIEIWNAAGMMADPFCRFVRMLIVTGQRRREVSDMAWTEIDTDKKLWTLPGERMKAGKLHEGPLSALALTLRGPQIGTHIFSTGRPSSGFSRLKAALDCHLLAARREKNRTANAMPEWRLHDIRRTVRSGMAELKVRPDVAERVLAHVPGGVDAVYDRHQYRDLKRAALELWGRHLMGIVEGRPANVVDLQARSA